MPTDVVFVNDAGKILALNIAESRRESDRWRTHPQFSGGFDECWLGWRHDRLLDPVTAESHMSQAEGPGLSILRVPTDGDDGHPNVDYRLAALWVFAGGQGAYTKTGHDDYSLTQHSAALDSDLGAPLGPPTRNRHVWRESSTVGGQP